MIEGNQNTLKGKLYIQGMLRLETGLHIGASSDYAPIGAIDHTFIRDIITQQPIIPGSSIKGKLRTLLVKSMSKGYTLDSIENDDVKIKRMFGSANASNKVVGMSSRLQFFDLMMDKESVKKFESISTDTYIGEVKWENSIGRLTAQANPRQIERVPAGAEFVFRLVYNIERSEEFSEDMETLIKALKLIQMDYLGGHGSRGYGRISLGKFSVELLDVQDDVADNIKSQCGQLAEKFNACNIFKRD